MQCLRLTICLAAVVACAAPAAFGDVTLPPVVGRELLKSWDAAVAAADRLMPACVDTVRGAMEVEREYLPGVLECEVGGFRKTPAALEAQAIVARTYLLAHLTRQGPECRK